MKDKQENEAKVFCSVCPEWEIADLNVAPSLSVAGKKHYFCNDDCLEQFKKTKK